MLLQIFHFINVTLLDLTVCPINTNKAQLWVYTRAWMSENYLKGLSERCYPDKKDNLRTCSILDMDTKSK